VYDSRVREAPAAASRSDGRGNRAVLFERSLAQLDVVDWESGVLRRDTAVLTYQLRQLYNHLSSAQSLLVGGMPLPYALLLVLLLIGAMFLIIEAVALIMGLALARSITSSVHELFMGTERVR
jgi:hypothetical protein